MLDPEMVVYEVLPYAPAQADRIIEHLCRLAGLDVVRAGDDPVRAERVRQAFGLIVDAARVRQEMLDLEQFERGICRPRWRDLLKELRHDRSRFAATIRDRSACIALRWALGDLGLAGRAGHRWLHYLRDNSVALRRTIDRTLEARLLQRDAARPRGARPGREPGLRTADRQPSWPKPDGRPEAHGTRPAAGPAVPCAARSAGDRRCDRLGDPPGAGTILATS
jgi:hypothetical protein